jgi:hypothetical protein
MHCLTSKAQVFEPAQIRIFLEKPWDADYSVAAAFVNPGRHAPKQQKGINMENRIIELAIEALVARKQALEAEIKMVESELKGSTTVAAAPAPGRRKPRTAAQRKAQAARMRAYWAAKNKPRLPLKAAAKAGPAKPKNRQQSTAARKAQSEKMKAYWAQKKAAAARNKAVKKSKPAHAKPEQKNSGAKNKEAGAKQVKVPF